MRKTWLLSTSGIPQALKLWPLLLKTSSIYSITQARNLEVIPQSAFSFTSYTSGYFQGPADSITLLSFISVPFSSSQQILQRFRSHHLTRASRLLSLTSSCLVYFICMLHNCDSALFNKIFNLK